jgi:phage gpG-like protein
MKAYVATKGLRELIERFRRMPGLGETKLDNAIKETTELARAELVDKITTDIRPHSGMGRKQNPQPVVTDLVDTGAYRASWQTDYPAPLVGIVGTNNEYAGRLEFGDSGKQKGFFPARDTAIVMRDEFATNLRNAILEALNE